MADTTETATTETATTDVAPSLLSDGKAADTGATETVNEDAGEMSDHHERQLETVEAGKKADPTLILGKFKTQDDLVKSYTELEKKFKEGRPTVPETYDIATPMKAVGWEPPNEADPKAKEQLDAFSAELKSNGFTQKQTEWMLQFGKGIIDQQVQRLGPATNRDAEIASLKKEWGDDFDARRDEISKYAIANLPEDVLNKPLGSTAAGLKFIADLAAKSKGSSPITDGVRGDSFDPDEAKLAINDAMAKPEYWQQSPAGEALRNRVYNLHAKLAKK